MTKYVEKLAIKGVHWMSKEKKVKIAEIETKRWMTPEMIQEIIDNHISPDVEMVFVDGKVWDSEI